jgi:hypothetical protein
MAKEHDDDLPPEVQAKVDAIRNGEPEEEAQPETAPMPEPRPLSRRAQAEQERNAQIEAANKRAEAAEKIAEELRASRIEDRERMARVEQAITMFSERQMRQAEPQQTPRDTGPSMEEKLEALRQKRDKALADGDITNFNKASEDIAREYAKSERSSIEAVHKEQIAQLQRQQQPQFQKPPWVLAIEAQHADVLMHPNGYGAVMAFVQLGGGQVGPESLDKAFKRARDELGLKAKNDEKNAQQRAVLSGGPTSSTPRTGGNGKAGKSVKLPAGWKDIAKRAGVPQDEYIRNYVAMHPESVSAD